MRSVLITGGTGGLGVAVVEAFLADGWRAVVPWIVGGEQERLPTEAIAVEADLVDPDDVGRAVRLAAGEASAPLGAVANLIGGFAAGQAVADTPLADFEAQFALNVRPTYLVTQCALPHLVAAGGGAIVCVSSKAALEPWAGGSGYAASKAAVTAFARAVAKEHADEGVRCNVISPTMIDTPANRASSPDAKMTPPAEVASVIRFLCSDDSAAVNGAVVPV
ncbi:MAG TPA: SDR family oxidoreductase [Solirubrobacteraceae bacterium]|nr:SDR family oxidoreductase [Solirubrobacteraceae bacterium]